MKTIITIGVFLLGTIIFLKLRKDKELKKDCDEILKKWDETGKLKCPS